MTHVLHQSAMQLAQQYLQCERELLQVLQQAIQSEHINLSRAKRILPVIDVSNAAQWIEKAATMDQRQLEREVAAENPVLLERPSLKPSSAERFTLHTGVSEEIHGDIEAALAILSRGSKVFLEEAVGLAFKVLLDKIDPLRKATRKRTVKPVTHSEVAIQQAAPVPAPSKQNSKRYLTAELKRELFRRDGNRCRHLNPDKTRCDQRTFLEIHHIRPLSEGGATTLENLITVCSGHHSHLHRNKLPVHPLYLSRTGSRGLL